MAKKYIRIDDRLIHGQIIVSWCKVLSINEIIAIDNGVASNATLKKIMTMGVPSSYKVSIIGFNELDTIKESNNNQLIIVRNLDNILDLINSISEFEVLYLGNIQKNEKSLYNLSSGAGGVLFLSDQDVEVLDKIEERGIQIIIQMVPQSSLRTWEQVRKTLK